MDEDEPMQTQLKYLSNDENTASQFPMSDQNLTKNDNTQCQTLNQFVVHPNEPTDAAQITILTYNGNMTNLSPSATINSESQMSMHI